MATVSDLCTAALKRIGVISQSEVPSSGDLATAFETLNQLMDQWAAERLAIYTITRTTFPIVSGTNVYSVGFGEAVNIARPVFTADSTFRFQDTSLDPVLEMGLNNLTDDAWARIALKGLSANYPTSAYYNPTYPAGTLTYWPIPTSATIEGVVYAPTAVPQFAATSDAVALPPGYQRFITTNLAVELAPEFGAVPSDDLRRAAAESKATIKRANIRLSDLAVDSAALVQGRNRWGYYNIYQN